jgi:hypothetical protein
MGIGKSTNRSDGRMNKQHDGIKIMNQEYLSGGSSEDDLSINDEGPINIK